MGRAEPHFCDGVTRGVITKKRIPILLSTWLLHSMSCTVCAESPPSSPMHGFGGHAFPATLWLLFVGQPLAACGYQVFFIFAPFQTSTSTTALKLAMAREHPPLSKDREPCHILEISQQLVWEPLVSFACNMQVAPPSFYSWSNPCSLAFLAPGLKKNPPVS